MVQQGKVGTDIGDAVSDVVSDMALSLDGTDVDQNTSVAMSVGPGATSVAKWRAYPHGAVVGQSTSVPMSVKTSATSLAMWKAHAQHRWRHRSAWSDIVSDAAGASPRHRCGSEHIGTDVGKTKSDIGSDMESGPQHR